MLKIKKSKVFFTIIFSIITLALVISLVIDLMPLFEKIIANTHDERKVVSYVQAYGLKGMPSLIALQFIQVILSFFPSAPVQILAGLCYGFWYGFLICLLGYIAGNLAVFMLLRQFKNEVTFLKRKHQPHDFLSLNKLKKMKRPERLVFLLYLVPGVPNGILPYLFAETDISLKKYSFNMIFASIPSIIICTWIGDNFSKGNYTTAIVVMCIIIFIGVLGFLFKNKIVEKIACFFHNNKRN